MPRHVNLVICLDFDGVLFDLRRFTAAMQTIFKRYGVNEEFFLAAYQIGQGAPYTLEQHLQTLHVMLHHLDLPRHRASLTQEVYQLLFESQNYILENALDFLAWLEDERWRKYLVSYGGAFQETKVKESGITHWFEGVVITRERFKICDVSDIMRAARDPERKNVFVMVDDHALVIKNVKRASPKLCTIQLKLENLPGIDPDIAENADYVVYSFNQLKLLLENLALV